MVGYAAAAAACVQIGRTALMRACAHGHTEVVVQLLDLGADVNAQTEVY
jgi:ankyrin repeat protein